MSAQYPITAVFLDGTTPDDGSEPRLPYAQTIAIPAGTDADVMVTCIGQDGEAYSTYGTLTLAVAGSVLTTGTLGSVLITGTVVSGSTATLSISASGTAVTARVYPYSMSFVATSGTSVWPVVPESIYAILPNENE